MIENSGTILFLFIFIQAVLFFLLWRINRNESTMEDARDMSSGILPALKNLLKKDRFITVIVVYLIFIIVYAMGILKQS